MAHLCLCSETDGEDEGDISTTKMDAYTVVMCGVIHCMFFLFFYFFKLKQ